MRSYIIEGQSSEKQQQYTVEVIHFCNTNLKFHWLFLVTDSSVGKESACNAGDPSWISGWGRSAGEGIGYPLLYSWASLVTQQVKIPPAMRETSVWSLGWEDPLEKGKATHSSVLAWRIPGSSKEWDKTEWLSQSLWLTYGWTSPKPYSLSQLFVFSKKSWWVLMHLSSSPLPVSAILSFKKII